MPESQRAEGSGSAPFLEVRDLRVCFPTSDGPVTAVDGLSFRLERGEMLGIVGESGSGKSAACLAIMGLHNRRDVQLTGSIRLAGEELLGADPGRLTALRGGTMAMIYQDPLSALHPYYTVGWQIAEAYRAHNAVSKAVAAKRAVEMLGRVGIAQPDRRADDYPHHFSGGMRQRAMIAMALCCQPALLIADEPTTALDVTVQAQILDLLEELQAQTGTAIIVITHDLGVIAEIAKDVIVMYAGQIMERGSAGRLFGTPLHPYTWGLLRSMPRLDRDRRARLDAIPGSPPSLVGGSLAGSCPFHPRCRYPEAAGGQCAVSRPPLREAGEGQQVACHLGDDIRAAIFSEEVKPAL